jgi:hypothetical protein
VYDDWETGELWDRELKVIASSWVTIRPIETIRFLELEDPTEHIAPSVQMGTPWYDHPNGTDDLERGAP